MTTRTRFAVWLLAALAYFAVAAWWPVLYFLLGVAAIAIATEFLGWWIVHVIGGGRGRPDL